MKKNRSILIGWEQCSSSVTPVQKVQHQCKLHIIFLDYDWLKDNRKLSKPMTSWNFVWKLWKNGFKKVLLALPLHVFFKFILLMSIQLWLFSSSLELIYTCKFFKELKLHSKKRLVQFSAFWKTHSCKLIPNWTQNHMITYTNYLWIYTLALLKNDERNGVENSSSRAPRVLKKKMEHKWHWLSIKKPEWLLITAS